MLNHSLSGSDKQYLIIQVSPEGESLHAQIFAPESSRKNRDYGVSLDVAVESSVSALVQRLIQEELDSDEV